MAAIQNDRDLILQATVPRIIPILIPIDKVDGLPGRLEGIESDVNELGTEVNGLLNNTKDLSIRVSSLTVDNSTSTTLTIVRKNGITGTVVWSVFAGVATITGSGDSVTISGSSIGGVSVTVKAAIGTKEVFATINKVGALASQNTVNLATQVTGQLSNSNVSGLGALALLNTVNLNTQTTGALNGQTQVTNLGTLAYANSIAANQIGAGTLAAGVIYSGTINAEKINGGSFTGKSFTGGTFTGAVFQTSGSGSRLVINDDPNGFIRVTDTSSSTVFSASNSGVFISGKTSGVSALVVNSVAHGISISPSNGARALTLGATSVLPSPFPGAIAYHSTHGFIFSEGSIWAKPTWEQV